MGSQWRIFLASGLCAALIAAEPPAPKFELQTVRGRIVWLSATLAKRFQITEVPEAAERALILEAADGTLHPILEDVRGRSFRLDARLRDIPVELLVRKYPGSPWLQIIQVFERRGDARLELDYWCEICSIAMYELKDCDCCQGPIELRRRTVAEPPGPAATGGKSGK